MSSRGFVVLALVAVAAAFPASSPADLNEGTANGITYTSDETPVPVGAGQAGAVSAECLPGTRLIGMASNANTNGGAGILSSLRPDDGPVDDDFRRDNGATAFVHNTTGMAAGATVWALCASGKVRYPSRTTTLALGDTRSLKVPCPDGTSVLSGGFYHDGANSQLHLNALRPFDDGDDNARPDDGWKVRATNLAGSDKLYQAWAFCRAGVNPVYREQDETAGAGDVDFASRSCPNQARSVAGIGVDVRGDPDGRRISGLEPADDTSQGEPDTVPDDRAFVEVDNPTATEASYTLHLICAEL